MKRPRLNIKIEVFEVVDNATGWVHYRGPKDGAEFAIKTKGCENSTIRKIPRPSAKLQMAAYDASNASFNR